MVIVKMFLLSIKEFVFFINIIVGCVLYFKNFMQFFIIVLLNIVILWFFENIEMMVKNKEIIIVMLFVKLLSLFVRFIVFIVKIIKIDIIGIYVYFKLMYLFIIGR